MASIRACAAPAGRDESRQPADLRRLRLGEPPDSLPLASRLAIQTRAVLGDFQPVEAAVEQTFVNKDGVAA